MQIVIDIPDERYKKLVNPYQYNEALCDELKTIVRKGTQIPRNHGRLIDADELYYQFKYAHCNFYKAMKHTPTIIPAYNAERS